MRSSRSKARPVKRLTRTQLYDSALAAYQQGDLTLAETLCKKILKADAAHAPSLLLYGIICYLTKRLDQAENLLGTALKYQPRNMDSWFNLGLVYTAKQDGPRTEQCFRKTLLYDPHHAKACNNLGNLLCSTNRNDEAEQLYRRAIASSPNYALAYKNLASLLSDKTMYHEAISLYQKALDLNPNLMEAYEGLAAVYEKQEQFLPAMELFRKTGGWGALQSIQRKGLLWSDLEKTDQLLLAAAQAGSLAPTPPWKLLMVPDLSPRLLRRQALAFTVGRWGSVLHQPPLVTALPSENRKLHIGYLSADFWGHATMHLLSGVLEHHDASRFEITLYSYTSPKKDDPYIQRIQASGFPVRDLYPLDDYQAAQRIADDHVHLLIDLKGYTTNARPGIQALRPAPVIVSWLGYPGTLGHPRMADYIIGDPVVSPPADADQFSENLALMPHCYQPNDNRRLMSGCPSRASLGLPDHAVVMSNFNQLIKLNPRTLTLWCRLMKEVPNSVLWMLRPSSPEITERLYAEFEKHGVESVRMILTDFVPPSDHLGRLQAADLALDTWPCNSHTTASDALWAGVPLITLRGGHFAARVAASLLTAVGLPELITHTEEEYYQLALKLLKDTEFRSEIKTRLTKNKTTWPLFDTVRFTRDLERLYQAIWEKRDTPREKRGTITLSS